MNSKTADLQKAKEESDSESECFGDSGLNKLKTVHKTLETSLKTEIDNLRMVVQTQKTELKNNDEKLKRANKTIEKLDHEKQVGNSQFLELQELLERIKSQNAINEAKIIQKDNKIEELEKLGISSEINFKQQISKATNEHKSFNSIFESKEIELQKLTKKIEKRNLKIAKLKKENSRLTENNKISDEEVAILKQQLTEFNQLRRKGIDGFQAECSENYILREKL